MESKIEKTKQVLPFLIPDSYYLYPNSIQIVGDSVVCMIKQNNQEFLVVSGALKSTFFSVDTSEKNSIFNLCPLTNENAEVLRTVFPFTKPIKVLNKERSFGLGDRLGIAGAGHLMIMKEYDSYPVLAQQSIRELTLTNRTYSDVLNAASFAVFKAGYTGGFGADGDHLKKVEEVQMALDLGFTMITLDCSDYINNDVLNMSDDEVDAFVTLNDDYKLYLEKSFSVEEFTLQFSQIELKRIVLTYEKAIHFAREIYERFFLMENPQANYEISIDETSTPTTPNQHFFVANEMAKMGIKVDTIAPRFCGEFQKGVDYIGNVDEFEQEFAIHSAIARHFGYKLSIHSGSDKFSIFQTVGKYTKGRFHVKTAGTNWLEAMRVVAIVDPKLYRNIHKFALSKFTEATQYYHVTTNVDNIPNVDILKDSELPLLFTLNDARQLIHITYGFILSDKNEIGEYTYKNKLYGLWSKHEQEYKDALYNHIGKHLQLLYSGFQSK